MGLCDRTTTTSPREIILIVTRDVLDEVDFEFAVEVAEKAMGAMAQQRVPPTPNNFHTWFKYTVGTSADLNRAINILTGNKRKFDTNTNRDLFSTYVGSHTVDEADFIIDGRRTQNRKRAA